MQISARTSLIAGYEAELMSDVAALVRSSGSGLTTRLCNAKMDLPIQAEEHAAKLSRLRDATAVLEARIHRPTYPQIMKCVKLYLLPLLCF